MLDEDTPESLLARHSTKLKNQVGMMFGPSLAKRLSRSETLLSRPRQDHQTNHACDY